MKVTNEAVVDVLEKKLPGQHLQASSDDSVKVAISYPILDDTDMLKKRRVEWDETLRSIVSIGAATGNQIIGDWIDRAARGDISQTDVPLIVQMLRGANGGARGAKEIGKGPGCQLWNSRTAKELHDWIGRDQNLEAPGVAGRVREFSHPGN